MSRAVDVSADVLQVVMERSPAGMAVIHRGAGRGEGWTFRWCNEAFRKETGKRAVGGEVAGSRLEDVLTDRDARALRELAGRALWEGGSVREREFVMMGRGHEPTYWDVDVIPVRSPMGDAIDRLRVGPGEDVFVQLHDVTVEVAARRREGECLRQIREELHGILNYSPSIIFVKDAAGAYALVNEQFKRGLRVEDCVGKFDTDLFDAETAARLREEDRAVMESGSARTFEETISLGGRTMLYQTTKFPLTGADGEACGICGIASEVTALKEAEIALRESENLMRLVTDMLPALIAYIDRDERYVFNNKVYEQWLKLPYGKLKGRSMAEVNAPETYERLSPKVKRALAGEAVNFRDRLLYPDGEMRHVDVTYTPDVGEDGKVRGFAVMVSDVSELRRTEEALRAGEERLRLALEAADLAMWDIDLTSGEVTESDRLIAMFGLPPGTRHKRAEEWVQYVHEDDVLGLMKAYEQAIVGREDLVADVRVVQAGGGVRWVSMHGRVVRGAGGMGVRMVGVCADITRQKTGQQDLERAKETAEAASAAKDRFLAVLSHELRTPLTPVVLTLAALDMNENVPEAEKEDLAMIRRNIELETQLIDDLLDVTRISHGKVRLNTRRVKLRELLEHVLTICAAEAQEKGVMLTGDFSAKRDVLDADPARLEQVFWNLVKNAIKFTPEGGKVEIGSREVEGQVEICVRDTGVGIDAEAKGRIFNAFEQGEQTVTRIFGGLGLGLAISKAIVELHSGKIWVESAGKGQGAAFCVRLPLAPGEALAEHQPNGGHGRGHVADRAGGAIRVLVVDDHADTLRVMKRLLTGMGMQVSVAGAIKSAVAALERKEVDLLISDIGLPDGTGLELIGMAHRIIPGLPAIALSGFGMEADQQRSVEAGFRTHLTKPVGIEQLESAILEAIGK